MILGRVLLRNRTTHQGHFATADAFSPPYPLLIVLIQYFNSFIILRLWFGSARSGLLRFDLGATKIDTSDISSRFSPLPICFAVNYLIFRPASMALYFVSKICNPKSLSSTSRNLSDYQHDQVATYQQFTAGTRFRVRNTCLRDNKNDIYALLSIARPRHSRGESRPARTASSSLSISDQLAHRRSRRQSLEF